MNRIDRLSAILIHLQSKKVVTAKEIAARFDISLRTVYRDIRALELAGVPIGAEAGKGYFLIEGYNLPPVKFSKEEAGAVLMATKLGLNFTDQSVKKQLENAMFKIRSVLKLEQKDYLESIEEKIEIVTLPNSGTEAQFSDSSLLDLQRALAQRKVVNFDYRTVSGESYTNRDVEPLFICFYARHWHLIGYCRLRRALRDFRSDRIIKLSQTDQEFDRSNHHIKNYQDFLNQLTNLQPVSVRVTDKLASYLVEQKYYMGFVESKPVEGGEVMKFLTGDLKSFARWSLQFSNEIYLISPKEIRGMVLTMCLKTLENYQAKKTSPVG